MRTRLTPLLLILMLSTAVRADLMDDELAKAKALLIAGKSEDASIRLTGLQAAAQALVERTPSDDHALYILGSSAMLLGDDAVAGSALARAARLKPQNVVYALALGQLADMQDDADQAIARYKAATAIDATSVEAWTQLGLMQRQAGKPADAQASFEKAADLAPKDPKFPGLIGQALADQRKDDDALAMYNKALALDPKYAPAYSGIGQVNEAKGDLAAALAAYAKAADLTPEDFRSIAKLVQLNDTLGNTKDRDAARDRILALKKAGKVDAPSYCRQIFPAGKATVMVFEYLDPKLGEARYAFNVVAADGKTVEQRIALIPAMQFSAGIPAMFDLSAFTATTITEVKNFNADPTYEQVRDTVQQYLAGKLTSLSSKPLPSRAGAGK